MTILCEMLVVGGIGIISGLLTGTILGRLIGGKPKKPETFPERVEVWRERDRRLHETLRRARGMFGQIAVSSSCENAQKIARCAIRDIDETGVSPEDLT